MFLLDSAPPLAAVILALGVGGSAAVIGAAFVLGIRHGIDWDHIAAITDITSTTATTQDPQERWLTAEPAVMLTDESHHSLARDSMEEDASAEAQRAIGTSQPDAAKAGTSQSAPALPTVTQQMVSSRPANFRQAWSLSGFLVEQRRPLFLGTLYALGHGSVVTALGLLAILSAELLPSWLDPIMERVVGITLILLAAYLFYSLYRFFRGGHEFRLRSRWMLVFAGVRNGLNWLWARIRGKHEHEHVHAAQQYGIKTAYGVGLIHGIGAETGTQVLVIATAVGAGTKAMGIAALMAFVLGLLISNSMVTIATTAGFISSRRRQSIYVFAGLLAACFSLAIGLVFLLRVGGILPDLGQYFRWMGGPET